jgi:hypothetical protein
VNRNRQALRLGYASGSGWLLVATSRRFPWTSSPKAALDPKLLSTGAVLVQDAGEEAVSMIVGRAREGVYAVSIQERGQGPGQV